MASPPTLKTEAAFAALVLCIACGPAPRAPVEARDPGPGPSGPAAGAGAASPLRAESVELSRISQDVVEARLSLVNETAQPIDPRGLLALRVEDGAAASGIVLVEGAAQRKSFVLRDANDRPLCSTDLGPIAPGERRGVWARFPAPAGPTVVVVVPGLAPLAPVAVPPVRSP